MMFTMTRLLACGHERDHKDHDDDDDDDDDDCDRRVESEKFHNDDHVYAASIMNVSCRRRAITGSWTEPVTLARFHAALRGMCVENPVHMF
jgi:hypothetical protein